MPCYTPRECADCRFFEKRRAWTAEWLCGTCLVVEEDTAEVYFSSGNCEECGGFSPVLCAVVLASARD
jgi:hypothetical protein